MLFILFLLGGDYFFSFTGIAEPAFYKDTLKENRIALVFLSVFVANAVINSMSSTGAFEILVDGVEVWSKLKTGQAPASQQSIHEVLKRIEEVSGELGMCHQTTCH